MEALHLTLSEQSTRQIHLLYRVAKSNGSLVSPAEIVPFLKEKTSEKEVIEAIQTTLSSDYGLESDYIVHRADSPDASALLAEWNNRERALENIRQARRFVPLLSSEAIALVAVSGSTSYSSSARSDDIDLFCVTRAGTMWTSFARALLLARAFRLANRRSPPICLSCVMDEEFATSMFAAKRDALFARDALKAVVLKGDGTYRTLIKEAGWISDFYPQSYASQTASSRGSQARGQRPGSAQIILNRLLFHLVGTFIRVKASMLNRKLAKQGLRMSLFRLLSAEDHCIYESRRYAQLRLAYSEFESEASTAAAEPQIQQARQ